MEWSTSSIPTFRTRDFSSVRNGGGAPPQEDGDIDPARGSSRCPNFAGFMGVCLATENELGLHPFVTNILPNFEDVILGGGSFDVRKVKTSSFLKGLGDEILRERDFVVVKHPRPNISGWGFDSDSFADAATELQILRHPPLATHENIITLLAVMYHDTGEASAGGPRILPALVLEYADYGSLKAFQEHGHGSSLSDRIQIATETATGLKALHDCGIIHGDIKPSNLLVCKHPNRKFVVKLSDFGFSLSVDDKHLIGHSQLFCAPESYEGNLRPEFLKQLDIYSYGLTLLTSFECGSYFYDKLPVDGLEENLRKMKKSNMISTVIPIRVLMGRQNEGLPLIILCKLWFYCLQSDPVDRFSSVDRILVLLKMLQIASEHPEDEGDNELSNTARIQKAVDSMRHLAAYDIDAHPDPPNSADAFTTMCLKIAVEIIANLPPDLETVQMTKAQAKGLRDSCAKIVQMLLWIHKTATVSEDLPLGKSFHDLVEKRTMSQVFEVLGTPEDPGDMVQLPMQRLFSFLVDLSGLAPEPKLTSYRREATGNLAVIPTSKQPGLSLKRHLDFVPDFREASGVYQKMPTKIQADIIASLRDVVKSTRDNRIKAAGAFSLAVAHINGIGVDYNLEFGQAYLLDSAKLGHEEAQNLFINAFDCRSPPSDSVSMDEWIGWLEASATAGNVMALQKLKDASPSSWITIDGQTKNKELQSTDFHLRLIPSQDGDEATRFTPRQAIMVSIVQDQPQSVQGCIVAHAEILSLRVTEREETPLLIACRLGRLSIIEILLQSGSDSRIGDSLGITPLHWLSKFPPEGIRTIAQMLHVNGGDPNAQSVTFDINEFLHSRTIQPDTTRADLNWTPLQWAVAANKLAAVDALLEIGADPLICSDCKEGEAIQANALQMASMLCFSDIVSRILEIPSARKALVVAVPMVRATQFLRGHSGVPSGLSRDDHGSFVTEQLSKKKCERPSQSLSSMVHQQTPYWRWVTPKWLPFSPWPSTNVHPT